MTTARDVGPFDDGRCFACGPDNPSGLQLRFVRDGDDGAHTTVTLPAHLQGYRDVAHGGIVMLLLDEVMAYAAGNAGEKAMTAAVSVRFRASVPLGAPLALRARVTSRRGKFLMLEGSVRDAAGTLLASAEGSFLCLGPTDRRAFGNWADEPAV